ncbi:MAG: hypothetical protein M1819_005834 [Sarea resinae]|nr:MAG: hypothetical protein M1819_005834 [Sarea resinae]
MALSYLDGLPDNANEVRIPCIVFSVLVPFIVGLRFWCRLTIPKGLGSDDWIIFLSTVVSVVESVLLLVACDYGFGHHIKDLHPHDRLVSLKMFWLSQVFYKVCVGLTKSSILLLYLRFMVGKVYRGLCWGLFTVVVLYAFASILATILECTPVPRVYDKSIAGTCINISAFWYANAVYSILTDVLILALPMPMVYGLKLPTRSKNALMLVFALGGFVTVTSILRMTTLNITSKTPDSTWTLKSTMWTVVELNIGIICACLPTLRPIIAKIVPFVLGRTTDFLSSSGHRNFQRSRGHDRDGWGRMAKHNDSSSIPMDSSFRSSQDGIMDKQTGIMKTTEVSVHYDEGHSSHSDQLVHPFSEP